MLSVNTSAIKKANIQTAHFWASTKGNITKITVEMNADEVSPTACRLGNSLSEATQIV